MIATLLVSMLTPDERDLDRGLLPPPGADQEGFIFFYRAVLEETFEPEMLAALQGGCPPELAADPVAGRAWTKDTERLARLVTLRAVGAVVHASAGSRFLRSGPVAARGRSGAIEPAGPTRRGQRSKSAGGVVYEKSHRDRVNTGTGCASDRVGARSKRCDAGTRRPNTRPSMAIIGPP